MNMREKMKGIGSIILYGGCFCLITRAIYMLAFLVPPQKGTSQYVSYQVCVGGLAVVIAGLVVGLILYMEKHRY